MSDPSSLPPSPRPQSHSITETTEYVLPQHANALGNVFGGQIMAWVDLCAGITASRHSGRVAVTLFVDDLRFREPVKVSQVVRLRAKVTAAFRTSMELEVMVEGEDTLTGRRWPCVDALMVFVAIDESGKPTPVPELQMDSDDVRASQAAGEARRAARLKRG